MNLKRLWDTENKKVVRAIPTWDPHKKLQVWTDDEGSKLYVYDNSKYQELNKSNPIIIIGRSNNVPKHLNKFFISYFFLSFSSFPFSSLM